MGLLVHMPMTVAATLASVAPDADALVVLYRGRENQSWRVGWSTMPLSDLCLAKELLTHEVQNVVRESYVESVQK